LPSQRVEILTRQECERKAAEEREALELALRDKELELIQVKGARDLLSQRVGLVEAELEEALGGKERAIELGVDDRFAVAELRRTVEAISGVDDSKKHELVLKEKVISDLQTDLDVANGTIVTLKDKLTRLKALWKRLSEEMVSTIERLTGEVAHNNAEREEERNRCRPRHHAEILACSCTRAPSCLFLRENLWRGGSEIGSPAGRNHKVT
jgi:chromosome segregation ATPase